jgi:hypothetical protein
MGDRRNGLMRPWKRAPLARASAAAMSIEMLLPDLEWLIKLVPAVRSAVLGRLCVTANRTLGVRDKVGWGEEGGLVDPFVFAKAIVGCTRSIDVRACL